MDSNNNWQEVPYQQNSTEQNQNSTVSTPYSGTAAPAVADTKDGLCVAGLVLGIVGFFLNPLGICSILAIIFGAIGSKANGPKAGQAKIGLILGIASLILQFLVDLIVTIVTFGAGAFVFCC